MEIHYMCSMSCTTEPWSAWLLHFHVTQLTYYHISFVGMINRPNLDLSSTSPYSHKRGTKDLSAFCCQRTSVQRQGGDVSIHPSSCFIRSSTSNPPSLSFSSSPSSTPSLSLPPPPSFPPLKGNVIMKSWMTSYYFPHKHIFQQNSQNFKGSISDPNMNKWLALPQNDLKQNSNRDVIF